MNFGLAVVAVVLAQVSSGTGNPAAPSAPAANTQSVTSAGPQPTDASSAVAAEIQAFKNNVDVTLKALRDTEADFKRSNTEYERRLTQLDAQQAASAGVQDRVKALTERVSVVEERSKVIEERSKKRQEARQQQLQQRYDLGKKGLDQMIRNVTVIEWSNRLANLEQEITLQTDVWKDDDFRNGWDKLQTGGLVLGALLGGVAALTSDNTQKGFAITAGSTVGLSALAGLLKGRFGIGSDDAKKVKEKIERMELSRRAYDLLRDRWTLVEGFLKDNEAFRAELKTFKGETYIKADTDKKRTEAIETLAMYFDRFSATLEQVPQLFRMYESAVEQFSKYDSEKPAMDRIRGRIGEAKLAYGKLIEEVLSFEPEVKRVLRFPDAVASEETAAVKIAGGADPGSR